jgi:hypothetical protein
MLTRFYLCPYDTVNRRGGQIGRRCAMARHVPRIPNADGAVWDEAEILGNHCLVKLTAPPALHRAVEDDPDFVHIPTDRPTITGEVRNVILARLLALGYRATEVSQTQWGVRPLLGLINSAASEVRENATRTGFTWTAAQRLPPKTLDLDGLSDAVP